MSTEQMPSREYLEQVCDLAAALAGHIRRYWPVDGNELADPTLDILCTAEGLRRVGDVLDAVKAQRDGLHPGPVIEWQLRGLVGEWITLHSRGYGMKSGVVPWSYTQPDINSMDPPDPWQGWGLHVFRAMQAVFVAVTWINRPLQTGCELNFVGAEIDAVEQAVRNLREAIQFVPSDMQEMILAHLDERAASNHDLMTALNCGSKETLYGKRGRGGLTELVNLRLVKNERSKGGYYRPDKPPVQKAY